MKVRKPDNVRALLTRFRLRHVNSGCLLRSHNVNLPQWGFKQAEVACDKDKKADNQANNMWNIERHWNDLSKLYYIYIFIFYFFIFFCLFLNINY